MRKKSEITISGFGVCLRFKICKLCGALLEAGNKEAIELHREWHEKLGDD